MPDAPLDRAFPPRLLRARHLVPTERLVEETRATRWAFFPLPIAAFVLTGVLTYAAAAAVADGLPTFPGVTPAVHALEGWWGLHTAVLGLFAILWALSGLWLLAQYLRWYSTVYAITDHRVLVQRGFLSRAVDEIPVDQIRGVDAYQSLWARLFGYGSVTVSSEGGHGIGNEEWRGVPRPFEFQRTIETMVQGQSLPHLLRPAPGAIPPPPPPARAVGDAGRPVG